MKVMSFNDSTGWRSELLFGLAVACVLLGSFFPAHVEAFRTATEMLMGAGGAALAIRIKATNKKATVVR